MYIAILLVVIVTAFLVWDWRAAGRTKRDIAAQQQHTALHDAPASESRYTNTEAHRLHSRSIGTQSNGAGFI